MKIDILEETCSGFPEWFSQDICFSIISQFAVYEEKFSEMGWLKESLRFCINIGFRDVFMYFPSMSFFFALCSKQTNHAEFYLKLG